MCIARELCSGNVSFCCVLFVSGGFLYLHSSVSNFLPARHYASVATSWLWPCVCLSACLSVTNPSSVGTYGRIYLVFGLEASFQLCYTFL